MPWCKPCKCDGKSFGDHCAYCYKYYVGRIKKNSPALQKMSDYETYLFEKKQGLFLHQTAVDKTITYIIEKGGVDGLRVDWEEVQREAKLTRQKKIAMVTSRPGFDWLSTADYEARHKALATNGKRQSDGQYERELNGVPGVAMPHDPVVSVRFDQEDAEVLSEQLGSTDHCLMEDLESQQSASMLAMQTENTFGTVDKILGVEKDDEEAEGNRRGRKSMSTHPSGAQSSGATTPVKKSAAGADKENKSESKKPNKGGASSGASLGEAAGTSGNNKRANANGDGNAAAKRRVGRPNRDFQKEIQQELVSFAQADKDDVLWFGSEAKTKSKCLLQLSKDALARAKATGDATEAESSWRRTSSWTS